MKEDILMLHLVKTANLIPKHWAFCGLLLAAILALFPLTIVAQECKGGICVETYSLWDESRKDYTRYVRFSGFPRTNADYATDFYQIRGGPFGRSQYEGRGGPFKHIGTSYYSIQACRKRGAVIRQTFCTGWVKFTVY